MAEELIIKPPRPTGGGWVQWPWIQPAGYSRPYAIERWYNRGQEMQVLSAVEVVKPEGAAARPEFHISVSGLEHQALVPYRCSDSRARWALKAFGFEGWLEDNHVPGGLARNFWRPVADPLVGEVCPCVATEPAIREMQGDYVWRGVPYDDPSPPRLVIER
jgi:hypothetical protein